jgi:hypothetical protein
MSPTAVHPPLHARDPIGWTAAITLGFFVLCLVRLTIPSKPFFDEIHYLPAARAVIELSKPLNPEHPPLGKEILALGIALFGDRRSGACGSGLGGDRSGCEGSGGGRQDELA